MVGFGLQTPVNRYLLAVWVGLIWGVWTRVEEGRRRVREGDARRISVDEGAEADDIFGDGDGEGDNG
jgi:hypothetical protein